MGKHQSIQQAARGMDSDDQQVSLRFLHGMQDGRNDTSNLDPHHTFAILRQASGQFFQSQFNRPLRGGFVGDVFEFPGVDNV